MPPRKAGRKAPPREETAKPLPPSGFSDFEEIFLGEGTEDLTEEKITQLIADGWEEKGLREAAAQGAVYSKPRNSLIFPPEAETF